MYHLFGHWVILLAELAARAEPGLFLRGVVGLDGFGLDDDRGITVLVVLTLRGDGARHVTRHHREGDYAQRYNHYVSHFGLG